MPSISESPGHYEYIRDNEKKDAVFARVLSFLEDCRTFIEDLGCQINTETRTSKKSKVTRNRITISYLISEEGDLDDGQDILHEIWDYLMEAENAPIELESVLHYCDIEVVTGNDLNQVELICYQDFLDKTALDGYRQRHTLS